MSENSKAPAMEIKAHRKSLQVPKRPRFTRLSSMTSTTDDVSDGGANVIVVPHRYMLQRSHSYSSGFAASLGKARREVGSMDIEDEASRPTSPESPGSPEMYAVSPEESAPQTPITPITPLDGLPSADTFAFAFDIDGVLVRGGKAIPEAIEAMKMLNGENKYGVKVPYIFLTNGGGKTEGERCLDLSRQLDISVSPAQFICGHTPMRELTEAYGTVLVVGGEGEKCRQVAEGYGFKDVITPGDIIKHDSATTPFRKLTDEELHRSKSGRDLSKVKIEAIFVFADSRDWAGDCQIMLDLAMSKGGYLGTLSETFDEGPPIFFSHSDMVWSAAHANVRLGMGALRRMLETLFRDVTKGKELKTTAFGKPQRGTFEFATRLLRQWRKDEHAIDAPPETVYFVGDTPESDIRGTNEFNARCSENDWFSILVKTGVWQDGTVPAYQPRATVDNVLEAVKFGLEREFGENGARIAARKELIEPLSLADGGVAPTA